MSEAAKVLVQYVVVRSDLASSWPLGAIIAQACHACVAALAQAADGSGGGGGAAAAAAAAYVSPSALPAMHKIVLGTDGADSLAALAARLRAASVAHHVWVEQPEGVPTCLASAPAAKADLAKHFAGLRLLK
jgi:peptidyl-tRNA hydrolase